MKKLLKYADVLAPNLTEACTLLDLEYPNKVLDDKELEYIAVKLCEKGPSKVVITGLQDGQNIHNFVYEKGVGYFRITTLKLGEDRSGTGDVFTSIVISNLVKGVSFKESVKRASDFIYKTIEFTMKLDTPVRNGLCFEEYLTELK